jgi:hypothetical protein
MSGGRALVVFGYLQTMRLPHFAAAMLKRSSTQRAIWMCLFGGGTGAVEDAGGGA